eukprot:626882_1
MTETQNVATYARIRPYNPAINEDKRLTARCAAGCKILNQNGANQDTYNFTKVYDMTSNTNDLFETGMKPLLDYKILQGINSIFIVYGQSGSGKSFTLIGEPGHLGVLPMSLQYLLKQDKVESIKVASIEAYGIKATKIGFYDLVHQLKEKQKAPKKFDAYSSKDNSRVNAGNAEQIEITASNCLSVITELQEVSHMAPTLKNPHSSRGHTVYFNAVKMTGLEDVYFIAVDLAGSEGQTALGTKDEFVEGLKLAMSKGKLKLNKKQMKGFETMYKTRSLEAGCINNGLTQLQTIFGELIRKKISKSMGLGLRKVLSSFISLKSAYAILFTLSASANNNKVTRATLNFAKQTQLVKVDTQKAKAKIDKDKIIKELNALIEALKGEMSQKNGTIKELKQELSAQSTSVDTENKIIENSTEITTKYEELIGQLTQAEEEEAQWKVADEMVNPGVMNDEAEMKAIFDEFDEDGGGSIDAEELQHALTKMGHTMTMDEVNELIHEIDENGDGEVDFDEFKVMATKSWFVDAFQSKLVASMERMMNAMNIMNDDEEDEDKEELDEEDEEYDDYDADELVGELNQRKQTIMDLQNELSQMKGLQVVKEEDSIEDLQEQIEDKDGVIEELQGEMEDTERQYKEEIDKLHEQIASLMADQLAQSKEEEERKSNEEEELVQLKTDNDELRQNQNRLESEMEEIENDLNVMRVQNQGLQKGINAAKNDETRINQLEQQNNEAQNMMEAMTTQVEDLKFMMDQVKEENQELNENVNGLHNELKALTISKIDMIVECNQQLNLLRNGIRVYQNNHKTSSKWLPFTVDFKWDLNE